MLIMEANVFVFDFLRIRNDILQDSRSGIFRLCSVFCYFMCCFFVGSEINCIDLVPRLERNYRSIFYSCSSLTCSSMVGDDATGTIPGEMINIILAADSAEVSLMSILFIAGHDLAHSLN